MGSVLYPRLAPTEVLSLLITGLVIIILAALYPAWQATRLSPVEALRYLG